MAVLDPKALYHRTLGDSLARLPYVDYALRQDTFESAAAKSGMTLGTALTIRDGNLVPVVYVLKRDQDFKTYATSWEILHSKLPFGSGSGSADPVVDENMTVVGHHDWYGESSIFLPSRTWRAYDGGYLGRDAFDRFLATGAEVFADEYNRFYLKQGYEKAAMPQGSLRLVTDPEGRVIFVTGARVKEALESSWVTPWDIISIAKLVAVAASAVAGAIAIRMIARKVALRTLGAGVRELTSGTAGELTGDVASGATRDGGRELGSEAGGTARNVPGGRPPLPPIPPLRPPQIRMITSREMLAWEQEGGHTLQNHNPLLTRQQLKARVIGMEEVPAPTIAKGGVRGADMRVWQGVRQDAASKWTSEETMHRTISDAINKNLAMIRSVTQRGGRVALEKIRAGYTTGAGWITTAGKAGTNAVKAGESAMFYSEELTGVTIYIEPTTANAEGWYVRTAFPEMVE
jgi:hypothetical protein